MMFTDEQFMTAKDKALTLKAWVTFLKHGLQRQHFTKRLYHHLYQHCEFIAHFNDSGFYESYFVNGEDTIRFLHQFDEAHGCQSVEYGSTGWLRGHGTGRDLSHAMIEAAKPFLPGLYAQAAQAQEAADLAHATALLAKHGRAPAPAPTPVDPSRAWPPPRLLIREITPVEGATLRQECIAKLNPGQVRVSPKFHALLQSLLGVEGWVTPSVGHLTFTSDGFMLGNMGNEFLGDARDLRQNIVGVAECVHLSDDARHWLLDRVRYTQ